MRRTRHPLDRDNPRYTRRTGRTGRIPLTLMDGSGADTIARDLRVFAFAAHFSRPCWSQTILRYAQQIEDGLDAADAVLTYTDTPGLAATLAEQTVTDAVLTDLEPDGPPLSGGP